MDPVIRFILPAIKPSSDPVGDTGQWESIEHKVEEARVFLYKCFRDITRLRFPSRHWYNCLQRFFTAQARIALDLKDDGIEKDSAKAETRTSATVKLDRRKIIQVLHDMQSFGLGGSKLQQALAEALDEMMTKYVQVTCVNEWESPSQLTKIISDWIEQDFARFTIEAFRSVSAGEGDATESPSSQDQGLLSLATTVSPETVTSWKEMAYSRLGSLRVRELFDIIVDLENSKGALEDLKVGLKVTFSQHYANNISSVSLQVQRVEFC